MQVWHHNTLGFDESLGVATCDKTDETAASSAATMYRLPLVLQKKSSSQGGGASSETIGYLTVHVTNRHKLDGL